LQSIVGLLDEWIDLIYEWRILNRHSALDAESPVPLGIPEMSDQSAAADGMTLNLLGIANQSA
jgi:hypothetical protein